MHELGIVCEIIRTVEAAKAQHCLTEIDSVVLQIGEMSDIVPRFIEDAWRSAVKDTEISGADLLIEIVPAAARCNSCGYQDSVKNLGLNCPECDSMDFSIISGRELLIKEITAR